MPYLKPCHATGFNNNGTKVYTVTYRRASPASAHRHDSRAALSEVKDIDDISTETIIMIITRHRSRQPAHVRAAASPPHARRMPASCPPTCCCCCCGRYITHIYSDASPHQPYPHTMRGACRLSRKASRSTSDRWLGLWKLKDPSPARGAVGSLESQRRSSSVRYPAFLANALAPPMGHLFASAYRTRGGTCQANALF